MALSTVVTVSEIRATKDRERVKLSIDLDDPSKPDFWFAGGDVESVWVELTGDEIGTMKLEQRFRITIEQVRAKRKAGDRADVRSTPPVGPAGAAPTPPEVELEVVLDCTHVEVATVPPDKVEEARGAVGEAYHCKECGHDTTILTIEPKSLEVPS